MRVVHAEALECIIDHSSVARCHADVSAVEMEMRKIWIESQAGRLAHHKDYFIKRFNGLRPIDAVPVLAKP